MKIEAADHSELNQRHEKEDIEMKEFCPRSVAGVA